MERETLIRGRQGGRKGEREGERNSLT